jgi:cardiolipin synthase
MKAYLGAEEITLVYSGSNFFEVLATMIDECREVLHIQTYIFEADHTGLSVIESIKKARSRNVEVFLMVDAYGSIPFPQEVADDLLDAGVHFRMFSPLLTSESAYIGRRLHHKVVVADKRTGLIGGINIADKYNTVADAEAWLDYAVLCRGAVCEYLHLLCNQFYMKRRMGVLKKWERLHRLHQTPGNHLKIRFRRNDWLERQNEIHKSHLQGLYRAKKSVIIVASYFLPGGLFRRLLKEASLRGVSITIIMAGRSDISSMRLAESYLYDFYLRHNIRLFEWSNSVMHGKAMIVDDQWCTIGSYNLNFLSHYISIELNAEILDPGFIRTFSAHLHNITQTCCLSIDLSARRLHTGMLKKLAMWLAYNFYRTLSGLALSGKKFRNRHASLRDVA